jgi:cell division septation protein DedD
MPNKKFAIQILLWLLISLVFVFFFPMLVKADYVPQSSTTLNLSSEFGVSWAGDDVAYAMTPIDSENSTVLAGYTTSFGAGGSDVWLVKVTSRLNFLNGQPWFYRYMVDWRKTYGGAQDDGAKGVIQAGDGCYIIAGYTESYGAGGFDMYLAKVDPDGNLLWNRTYGGSQDDGANCIVQASDGGYIIAGYTNSGVQSQSAWLVKIDSSGQVQWNRTVSGIEVNSIICTSDGGYVLATKYFAGFELVKLDSSCQVQWNQTYIGPDNSAAESAIQTNDGGYAIAGWENVSQTSTSARLIKTDSSGNVQWDQTYAGLGAFALIQTSSGGYALTGDRAFLIITNSSGHVQWNRNYDALSEDNLHFTRTYYIAESISNQFVMAGTQQSYGMILTGLDGRMITITLRYAADTTPESTPAPTSTPSPAPSPTPTPAPTATPTPQPTATSTPSPTASPSPEPTPTPEPQEEPHSSTTILVAVASVLITNAVGGSLLVYFKKRKH